MIVVVLPAYNEAECIGALLESFCHALVGAEACRFIIVNDGSSDETADIIRGFSGKLTIDLVEHDRNRGLAEAMKTGLLRAVETSADEDIIITMDADNTHLPDLMFRMARLVNEGSDVVIASRYRPGARVIGLSLFRRMLSYGASLLFRLILPFPGVRDYTCGYRAYRAALIKTAFRDYGDEFISEPGFSCMVDIILKLRKYGPRVTEVPLTLRYDQKLSSSKMNVKKTMLQTLRLLVLRRLGR